MPTLRDLAARNKLFGNDSFDVTQTFGTSADGPSDGMVAGELAWSDDGTKLYRLVQARDAAIQNGSVTCPNDTDPSHRVTQDVSSNLSGDVFAGANTTGSDIPSATRGSGRRSTGAPRCAGATTLASRRAIILHIDTSEDGAVDDGTTVNDGFVGIALAAQSGSTVDAHIKGLAF